jgi:hypothetical protein
MADQHWPVPDRRCEDKRVAKLAADVICLRDEVGDLKARVTGVEEGLSENTQLTSQIAGDTKFLRELLSEARGAIRFLCRIAQAWRFLLRYVVLPALAFVLLLYYFTHGYQFPEWFKGLAEWLK